MTSDPVVTVQLPVTDELIRALAPAVAEIVAEKIVVKTGSVDEWLDVEGAAKYLACGASRIYALKHQGALPFHKDGSRLLFRRSELDAYVAAGGAKRV